MDQRALYKGVWDQLSADKPLVMLAGPRQAGKTTFAKEIAAKISANPSVIPSLVLNSRIFSRSI